MSNNDTNTASTGRRVYVKADSDATDMAKKISMAGLEGSAQGFPVRVLCRRAPAVALGVKSAAIATGRLKAIDDTDLVVVPAFRENRNEVVLMVDKLEEMTPSFVGQSYTVTSKGVKQSGQQTKPQQYKVGNKTDIKVLAGAVSNAAREGRPVELLAIGQTAVFQAIRSVAVAREYLAGRGDDVDVFCTAGFEEVQIPDQASKSTAIRLTCSVNDGRIEF